ncbi:MAG: hypothetical protein ACYDHU_09705 [Acidimicrobiales bacterium]
MTNDSAVVLGAHIKSGTIWLACAGPDGELLPDRQDRLELADGELGRPRALVELLESLEAVLERLRPRTVVLLRAGTSSHPRATSGVQRRSWLEAVIMLACHRTDTRFLEVTHDRVKKIVGVKPSGKEFAATVAAQIEGKAPPRWGDRAPAYGAALTDALGGVGE